MNKPAMYKSHSMINHLKLASIIAGTLSLTACINLAPYFRPPEAPVPATFGTVDNDQKAITELAIKSPIPKTITRSRMAWFWAC